MKLSKPIVLPRVWQDLLARERLPRNAERGKDRFVAVDDETPYVDDCRDVEIVSNGYTVLARLCSGETNYWLDWRLEKGGKILDENEGDAEYDIGKSYRFKGNIEVKIVLK